MTTTRLFLGALAATALALPRPMHAQSIPSSPAVLAVTDQDHQAHHPTAEESRAVSPPRVRMAGMDTMMAAMKARAEKIDALVTKVRAASGDAKTDAIVELLTAMTEQHTMCSEMMRGHGTHEMPMHDHTSQSGEGHVHAK